MATRRTSKEAITREQLRVYERALYEVTTVIPYADRPVRCTYRVDQDGLDGLLHGYSEHAEFLVALRRADM